MNAIVDLKKISCTFLGVGISTALGVRTIKNWGSDKANLIDIENKINELLEKGLIDSVNQINNYTQWKNQD